MTSTEIATAQIKAKLQQFDANPKKNPIFDAMVKNFSQMAYINDPSNGLAIQPNVRSHALTLQSDDSDEEGKQQEDDMATKKGKLAQLFLGKKPEANDGDIENFYANDPSKPDERDMCRQGGPDKQSKLD